jgi:hypothetical protein
MAVYDIGLNLSVYNGNKVEINGQIVKDLVTICERKVASIARADDVFYALSTSSVETIKHYTEVILILLNLETVDRIEFPTKVDFVWERLQRLKKTQYENSWTTSSARGSEFHPVLEQVEEEIHKTLLETYEPGQPGALQAIARAHFRAQVGETQTF